MTVESPKSPNLTIRPGDKKIPPQMPVGSKTWARATLIDILKEDLRKFVGRPKK